MKKRWLFLVICLGLALGYLAYLGGIYCLNDRFLICHILSESPSSTKNSKVSAKEKEELHTILSQPFTYLGHGSQMYAFASEDGHYVLKFFKQQRLRVMQTPFLRHLPSFLQKIHTAKEKAKAKKRSRLYASCQLAWQELKEECGLIYFHLHESNDLNIETMIVDKLGRRHSLDLDNTHFIVQKKAELVAPTLERLIEQKNLDAAKERLEQLLVLLKSRCQKGIDDADASLAKNAGFTPEGAIYLDLGGFSKDPRLKKPRASTKEIRKITRSLMDWLLPQSGELGVYFKAALLQV